MIGVYAFLVNHSALTPLLLLSIRRFHRERPRTNAINNIAKLNPPIVTPTINLIGTEFDPDSRLGTPVAVEVEVQVLIDV